MTLNSHFKNTRFSRSPKFQIGFWIDEKQGRACVHAKNNSQKNRVNLCLCVKNFLQLQKKKAKNCIHLRKLGKEAEATNNKQWR